MAAPVSNSSGCWGVPEVYKHHEQRKICISRPKYREGRKSKAVKVRISKISARKTQHILSYKTATHVTYKTLQQLLLIKCHHICLLHQVYTINLESRYLMVQGVPAIGVMAELIQLCALYGAVEEYRPLDEYPAEEFTEVYLVKFQKLTSARFRMQLSAVRHTCRCGTAEKTC